MTLKASEQDQEKKNRWWLISVLLLFLIGLGFCLYSFIGVVSPSRGEEFIPVAIHVESRANYDPDFFSNWSHLAEVDLIEFVIRDRDADPVDVPPRLTQIAVGYLTPVPTVTPIAFVDSTTETPTTQSDASGTATANAIAEALTATAMAGWTSTPGPSPSASSTATPSETPTPTLELSSTASPTATASMTPTPSATPTGPCSASPIVIIATPDNGAHYRMDALLPGRAEAYDPDDASPTCDPVFPVPNGDGIEFVEFEILSEASGWSRVHYEDQTIVQYCAFTGNSSCNLHDLSSGQWPGGNPIELGRHKLYARAKDDEGQMSDWVYIEFYIDPAPPTSTPVAPTKTPTRTPVPPTNTPLAGCPDFELSDFGDSGSRIWWKLTNHGSSLVTIERIDVTWTKGDELTLIELNSPNIWDGELPPTFASIPAMKSWTGAMRRVDAGESKILRLTFDRSVRSTYSIEIESSNGCITNAEGYAD
jgi:hypothetical protein